MSYSKRCLVIGCREAPEFVISTATRHLLACRDHVETMEKEGRRESNTYMMTIDEWKSAFPEPQCSQTEERSDEMKPPREELA